MLKPAYLLVLSEYVVVWEIAPEVAVIVTVDVCVPPPLLPPPPPQAAKPTIAPSPSARMQRIERTDFDFRMRKSRITPNPNVERRRDAP